MEKMLEAIGPGSGPQRIERQGGAEKSARLAAVPAAGVYDIPASPPADLLTELDRAASVIDDLASRQVNIHFNVDDKSGKVQVQVMDGQGKLVREIPATRVLDVLSSGNARGLAVNAVG
jgi:flagellar protein FlaG